MVRVVAVWAGGLTIFGLLMVGTAIAGGWSVVKLDSMPTNVVLGKEVTIGFTVLQHGERPVAGLRSHIKATHASTGEQIVADAVDQGEVGHYVAQVVFPRAGTWNWVVNVYEGAHIMPPLEVAPVVVVQSQEPAPDISSASNPSSAVQATSETTNLTAERQVALGLGSAGLLLIVAAGISALRSFIPALSSKRR